MASDLSLSVHFADVDLLSKSLEEYEGQLDRGERTFEEMLDDAVALAMGMMEIHID